MLSILKITAATAAVALIARQTDLWSSMRLWASEEVLRPCISSYLASEGTNIVESSDFIRKTFCNLPDVDVHPSVNHSHPAQAGPRAAAITMMRLLALSLGRRMFMVQMSARDQRAGLAGSRVYHWMKDTSTVTSFDSPVATDLAGIVDTDYYMDMPHYLSSAPCPVVLYTMTPMSAGEVEANGLSYKFNRNNELESEITGGSTYKHHLWNYGRDVITARKWFGLVTQTWDVDRRLVTGQSSLVMLTPRKRWTGLASIATWFLDDVALQRLEVHNNGWISMRVHAQGKHTVSIAKVDSSVSATVPLDIDQGIRSTIAVAKIPITVCNVESQVSKSGVNHPRAALLCEYYRANVQQPKLTVYPVEYSVKRFQYRQFDSEVGPSVQPFMAPIVNDAFAPDCTRGNEEQSIEKRVTSIATPVMPITPDFVSLVEEFIQFVVPTPGTVVPVDEDEVWEKQSRPTQQRQLHEASMTDKPNRLVKAFPKREIYPMPKDPRNISTINPKDKLNYSRVTYAVAEVLKTTTWYAFGQTPRNIAFRVACICMATEQFIIPSDFSRLDGTISNRCRLLEHSLCMRMFAPEYHSRVTELMETQFNQKGVGTFGTKYDTLFSRLSGSPETSIFNSLVTAFVAYCGFRKMKMSPATAYSVLGIYGGDDGLTADCDPVCLRESAQDVGLKLTCEIVQKGNPGVHFLARLYTPDVWYGDVNSMCDLKRQLSKFHTCVPHGDFDREEKLIEKGFSYYLTDKHTPIIGPFVTRVKEFMDSLCIDIDPNVMTYDKSYSSLGAVDEQYPNEPHDWFDTHAIDTFPAFDAEMWRSWLCSVDNLAGLLEPPCLSVPDDPIMPDVFVNGITAPLDPTPCPYVCDIAPMVLEVVEEKFITPPVLAEPDVPAIKQLVAEVVEIALAQDKTVVEAVVPVKLSEAPKVSKSKRRRETQKARWAGKKIDGKTDKEAGKSAPVTTTKQQ